MTNARKKTIFLPGAGGSAAFWKPTADRTGLDGVFLAWPGLGDEPAHPDVNSINDLVSLVLDQMDEPVNIVAQSMGGLVALKVAGAAPAKVGRLVLTATSGGVPVFDLGGSDWREDYYQAFPRAAKWIAEPFEDLSTQIKSIHAPTLLLWGDSDPISPVAVGERLRTLLPDARIHVVNGADHDLAQTHADVVANLIEQHLTEAS
ncbi:MAG: alpha/beta hydrolase [Azospirillaceae bacterium]|nr:alpha/beta hydrolase [Azospirillaceae bacterium]